MILLNDTVFTKIGGDNMVLDRSKDSKPLYLQIKDILKHKIINNEYAVGSTIPSENELEDMFGVSRMTIRQAVNELVNEGLLRKERGRGKGTVVLSNAIADKLSTAYMTAVWKITYAVQQPPERFRLLRQLPGSASYSTPTVPALPTPADRVPIS